MQHLITIEGTQESFQCAEHMHVLEAMERTLCRSIPVGCRGGGCGACKVQVASGSYELRKMNRAVISADDESRGCVLACRLYPRSDLRVVVLGRAWAPARNISNASSDGRFSWTTSASRTDKET